MLLRMALPKGRLMDGTARLLEAAGWGLSDYQPKTRCYRLSAGRFPGAQVKIFQDKDIPVQVAIGNYDIGICGLEWAEELLAKYPSSALAIVKKLGFGRGAIYAAMAADGDGNTLETLRTRESRVRLAGEYPNLAEGFAERLRLRRFSVYPVWGAAEVYPPESADVVLLAVNRGCRLPAGLVPVTKVIDYEACLVANQESLRSADLSEALASIIENSAFVAEESSPDGIPVSSPGDKCARFTDIDSDTVRLALPDGHQQAHVQKILARAGVGIEDYPSSSGNRRPQSSIEGVVIKVIRPQDMPLQVASGNFDMAVTGKDWLTEHLEQFPSSPVKALADLRYGRVRIVAAVSQNVAEGGIENLRQSLQSRNGTCRVASEYVNIADRYARDNRLGAYRIVPTWGASEAFLPEDADLLIENTETGSTIARHNLRIIDTLFESTACLIGRKEEVGSLKAQRLSRLVELFKKGAEGE